MQRRADIDRAKGLAILLVVFGHIVARADPAGVTWYEPLRRAVYSFHMPIFFYLSGLVLMLAGSANRQRQGWLRRRAERLLLPFLAMGVLVVLGKFIAQRFIFVDHAPAGLWSGLAGLFWHTGDSADGSIWYLFVLFCYSAATPFLLRGEPKRTVWLLAAAFGLFFMPWPDYVYANDLGHYAVFFCAGLSAGAHQQQFDEFIAGTWRVWLLVLLVLLSAIALWGASWPANPVLLTGLCAIPALHGLVTYSSLSSSRTLLWLGRYCFMIYLFNTIFIGLAKALLWRLASWDGAHFLPFAMCLMLAGVVGPVALKQIAFQRIRGLDRLTD